jgi:hypothetical protein
VSGHTRGERRLQTQPKGVVEHLERISDTPANSVRNDSESRWYADSLRDV